MQDDPVTQMHASAILALIVCFSEATALTTLHSVLAISVSVICLFATVMFGMNDKRDFSDFLIALNSSICPVILFAILKYKKQQQKDAKKAKKKLLKGAKKERIETSVDRKRLSSINEST